MKHNCGNNCSSRNRWERGRSTTDKKSGDSFTRYGLKEVQALKSRWTLHVTKVSVPSPVSWSCSTKHRLWSRMVSRRTLHCNIENQWSMTSRQLSDRYWQEGSRQPSGIRKIQARWRPVHHCPFHCPPNWSRRRENFEIRQFRIVLEETKARTTAAGSFTLRCTKPENAVAKLFFLLPMYSLKLPSALIFELLSNDGKPLPGVLFSVETLFGGSLAYLSVYSSRCWWVDLLADF